MSGLILSALAPFWEWIAAGGAALVVAATLYWKGRADARSAVEKKDLQHANEIRKVGADARAADPADGMQNDGWRRD